MKIEIKVYAT